MRFSVTINLARISQIPQIITVVKYLNLLEWLKCKDDNKYIICAIREIVRTLKVNNPFAIKSQTAQNDA